MKSLDTLYVWHLIEGCVLSIVSGVILFIKPIIGMLGLIASLIIFQDVRLHYLNNEQNKNKINTCNLIIKSHTKIIKELNKLNNKIEKVK